MTKEGKTWTIYYFTVEQERPRTDEFRAVQVYLLLCCWHGGDGIRIYRAVHDSLFHGNGGEIGGVHRPWVTINKKKYMCRDLYAWIVGKMSLFGMNQTDLDELWGISQEAASTRLLGLKEGKDTIKHIDLAVILKRFEATDEEILRFMKL